MEEYTKLARLVIIRNLHSPLLGTPHFQQLPTPSNSPLPATPHSQQLSTPSNSPLTLHSTQAGGYQRILSPTKEVVASVRVNYRYLLSEKHLKDRKKRADKNATCWTVRRCAGHIVNAILIMSNILAIAILLCQQCCWWGFEMKLLDIAVLCWMCCTLRHHVNILVIAVLYMLNILRSEVICLLYWKMLSML